MNRAEESAKQTLSLEASRIINILRHVAQLDCSLPVAAAILSAAHRRIEDLKCSAIEFAKLSSKVKRFS